MMQLLFNKLNGMDGILSEEQWLELLELAVAPDGLESVNMLLSNGLEDVLIDWNNEDGTLDRILKEAAAYSWPILERLIGVIYNDIMSWVASGYIPRYV